MNTATFLKDHVSKKLWILVGHLQGRRVFTEVFYINKVVKLHQIKVSMKPNPLGRINGNSQNKNNISNRSNTRRWQPQSVNIVLYLHLVYDKHSIVWHCLQFDSPRCHRLSKYFSNVFLFWEILRGLCDQYIFQKTIIFFIMKNSRINAFTSTVSSNCWRFWLVFCNYSNLI